MVRHPVVVALSTKKWRGVRTLRPGKYETLASLVGHWVRAHQVLRDDLAHLARVHVVHYEHLLADPRAELDALGGFLGLPGPVPDDACVAATATGTSGRGRGWGTGCTRCTRRRRAVLSRYADEVADLGYDLADVAAPPRRVLAARAGHPGPQR